MERRWKLINRSVKGFELEIARIVREISSRNEIDPFRCREGWEFGSSLLDTLVVDIAFVDDQAYNQEELFLVNFEELLHPVIVFDTGSLNGGFDVGILCWSFGHGVSQV